MSRITGQKGVVQKIIEENDRLVGEILAELGLSKENSAQEIHQALETRLADLEKKLPPEWQGFCEKALNLVENRAGFFIKKEKAVELLEKYPPRNLLDFFGYKNVRELVDKESFESVFSALRFTQSTGWMHKFFDEAYDVLKPEDFEERPIQLKVLEEKWLGVAESFLEKKYHNVSHLKELGIIFVIPLKIDTPGEVLRVFTLLLHYLNEVPFYSKLFRQFSKEPDFVEKMKSLLRGDVIEISNIKYQISKINWLIIQRYLAKDNLNDPRLFLPHVNPEAEHWYKAQESLAKLGPDFEFWKKLDFVGGFFRRSSEALAKEDGDELVSFDLVDLVMTLVKKGETKYLYHQQEALWNKIFIEYFGRDKMNKLIEQNIIKGYIEL
ncbi:MAG: hypothetical protein AAB338_00940 [Patescibacteria group bacterium]